MWRPPLDEVEHPDFAPQGCPGVPPIHVGKGLADEAGGNGDLASGEALRKLGAGAHERGGALPVLVEAPLIAAIAGGAPRDDRGTALEGRRQKLDADGGDPSGEGDRVDPIPIFRAVAGPHGDDPRGVGKRCGVDRPGRAVEPRPGSVEHADNLPAELSGVDDEGLVRKSDEHGDSQSVVMSVGARRRRHQAKGWYSGLMEASSWTVRPMADGAR